MPFLRKKIIEHRFSVAERAAIREDQRVSTPVSEHTRFLFYDAAPEILSVPVDGLMEGLPLEYRRVGWGERGLRGRMADLPCGMLFSGNTPRLPLSLLGDLLPDLVHLPEGVDGNLPVTLPAGWLALHFRLVTRREPLPSGEEEADPKSFSASVSGDHAGSHEPGGLPSGMSMGKATASGALTAGPTPPDRQGLFAKLPVFHPLNPADHISGAVETGIPREVPLPAPLPPESVSATAEAPLAPLAPIAEPASQAAEPLQPTPGPVLNRVSEPAAILSLEKLWKMDPQDQLADPAALQALFMTEEKLTLEGVIALAGELPGLRACVMAHGDRVVCASNTAPGVDLHTLSGQAMTMLAQIRESSAQMGLGAVPAVTLHADQGIVSFLHNGEICLLVLHADRGFVPGVRERLQEMLVHLSSARALPPGSPAQPALPVLTA